MQATEGECDTAGDAVGLIGRCIERIRPIRFGDLQPRRATASLDVGIERHVHLYGGIEFTDRLREARTINALHPGG